ncbi:MAG TPA: YbaK/EbsC family protein [Actinomycetales bacterium]|nr:YbaK/EbsC family protein [Actinomycetales bacterium]
MADPLTRPSVLRVRAALAELGATGEPRLLADSARTAVQAADSLGVEVGQIASSLVFCPVAAPDPDHGRHERDGHARPLLVITSGAHRVDVHKVASLLGVSGLERATPDQVRESTGFAIGGVAPVGHPSPVPTLVDVDLARYPVVWAAAGHPHVVFPTTYEELVRITGGQAAEVA